MEIVYKLHARIQMAERLINESIVQEVISNPDRVISKNNIAKAIKRINGRDRRVIYTVTPNRIIVITVC